MIRVHTQRTLRVEYSSPVHDCARELRVFPPAQRGGQRVLRAQWQCEPPPTSIEEREDEFGNRVVRLHHRSIARELKFEASLLTSHDVSTTIAREINLPPTGVGAFLMPSSLCNWTDEILEAARDLNQNSPEAICEFAHQGIEYSIGATNLQTSASQSLHLKRGVCQDHAHLMIALCRALKIPARYVAGYIKGEGAMHAWAETLIENQWRGFDPTHNRAAREDYVVVACGRDARDCASHEGSFRGRATASLESWCKTRVLELGVGDPSDPRDPRVAGG